MKYSILMTVFDREPPLLMSTLRQIGRCDLTDCELIIVDDGSKMDYSYMGKAITALVGGAPHKWIKAGVTRRFNVGGFNCPARAFNVALEAAEGDSVVIMSSDTLVTPKIFERMRRFDTEEVCWTPMVIDIESGAQYLGPRRLFPAPWCLVASRKHCIDIGGWDEEYMKGLCYEDNDFIGRLMLKTGGFCADWTVIAYHQSHQQEAYNFENVAIKEANERNRAYTKTKWNGIPFDPEYSAFNVLRKPHPSGNVVHECVGADGLLEKAIEMTTGLIAEDKP